jgi:predicted enzyme related to lactoylglutathione lyase
MTEKRFPPGTFCWVELGTNDAKGAREFYTDLIGWTSKDVAMPEGMGSYMLLQLEGKDVAGMYTLTEEQTRQGVPPHWLSYVSVASADETASRVRGLGGAVLAEPFDVPGVGRMAILQDPAGAAFALFQPGAHGGAVPMDNRPGTFSWNELATTNPDEARRFYESLFGWTSEVQEGGAMGSYTTFRNAGRMAAGMMKIGADWGPVPPHWMVYFAVRNCDASVDKASRRGAEVRVPPSDIPDVGRFAVLTDPQGAAFSVVALLNPEPN